MHSSSKKWIAKVINFTLFLVLVVCTTFVMDIINKQVELFTVRLKTEIMSYLTSISGRRISFKSISPYIFRFIEIRDLVFYDSIDSDEVLLEINRVKVYYNLFNLLFGSNPIFAISEINIDNTDLNLDYKRDREIIDMLAEMLKYPIRFPDDFRFKLTGSNINLRFQDEKIISQINQCFFTVNTVDNLFEYSISGDFLLDYYYSKNSKINLISSQLLTRGKTDMGFSWFDMRVDLKSPSSSFVNMSDQVFQLSLRDDKLNITKIEDSSPIDFHILYDPADSMLSLNFTTDQLTPSRIINFKNEFADYNLWLDSQITAQGEVLYSLNQNKLNYFVDLAADVKNSELNVNGKLSSKFHGNEQQIFFQPLILNSNLGSIEYRGDMVFPTLLPQGYVKLTDVEVYEEKKVSAEIEIVRKDKSIDFKGKSVSIGTVTLRNILLKLSPQQDNIQFTFNAVFDQQRLDNSIHAEGLFKLTQIPLIYIRCKLMNIQTDKFYRLILREDTLYYNFADNLSQYSISSDFYFYNDVDTGNYFMSSSFFKIEDTKNKNNHIQFNLVIDNTNILINNILAYWQGYHISGYFESELAKNQLMHFKTQLRVDQLKYSMDGVFIPTQGLVLSGDYNFNLSLIFTEDNGSYVFVKMDNLPIPVNKRFIYVTLDLKGCFPKDGQWNLVSSKTYIKGVALRDTDADNHNNSIESSFSLKNNQFQISKIIYKDNSSELTGNGNITYTLVDRFSSRGWLYMAGNKSNENYLFSFDILPENMDLTLNFQNSPLRRFGDFIVTGDLSGEINLTGPIHKPNLALVAFMKNGKIYSDPFSFDIELQSENDMVAVNNLELKYFGNNLTRGRGIFNQNTGNFNFNALFEGENFGDKVLLSANLSGELSDFKNIDNIMNNSPFSQDIEAKLLLSNIMVNQEQYDPWQLEIIKEEQTYQIAGGPGNSMHGSLSGEGEFSIALTPPLPINCVFNGRIKDGWIDTDVNDISIDLKNLNSIIKADMFKVNSGFASGKLAITGPLNDPDISGLLKIENCRAIFDILADEIGPFNTEISLLGETKRGLLKKITLPVGDNRVALEGELIISHWIPHNFKLTVKTLDTAGVHVSYPFPMVNINGYATTKNLTVTGNESGMQVTGGIFTNYCVITLTPDEQEEEEEVTDYPIMVNLDIKAGRGVEFHWPSMDFPVISAYANPGSQLAINYDGRNGDFSLIGEASIKTGQVFYFDRNFYLKSGKIIFEENQDQFDPRVSVLAEMRERDLDNREIMIFLIVENQRMSEFSPVFESNPPLPQADIIAFLYNVMEPYQQNEAIDYALEISSDILTQYAIMRPFEQAIRQLTNLDVFSIRTHIVKNVIMDNLAGELDTSIEREDITLGYYLDNTTINLGKYLDNDLFLEMVLRFQTLEAGDNNTIKNIGDIDIESEISLELMTPLSILIKWTLTPEHPETLFLTDNTLSFEWGFSF